ncbi:DMT family transporter [Desulfobulbus rhabdoformis]|uniref:DMT family transporter n=1 Tax=Desulfobulbus rhabdoformis TaxID=34032 RepID=UPI001F070053|nr:DMT family transporter [Desulfobulbus rhabdoformis]
MPETTHPKHFAASKKMDTMKNRQRLLGGLAVLGSALLFYLATAIIHWSHTFVTIGTSMFTFSRFVLGFAVVSLSMVLSGKSPRCNHLGFILIRMLTNTIAVFCFYKAVEVGSVAEANILNMTYPLFVALLSWFLLKRQRDIFSLAIVALATIGIWLILSPDVSTLHLNDFWGLLSGFFAGFAILSLNLSRQYDEAQTILWYMFGLGTLLMLPMVYGQLHLPSPLELLFLFACSMAGVGGQYLLTYGFRFVTAVEGAVVSSSRILIAALLGPLLVSDPPLGIAGWLGALLIFSVDIALALRAPKE